ncbi:MAG: hypothetical protein HY805_06125 [Nitrospirae bacterium]|nr:hypothetical protein [Nitrospirota bacterium]
MQYCEGFRDWLKCLRCVDICTGRCPLEKENLVEGMRVRMLTEGDIKSMFNELNQN